MVIGLLIIIITIIVKLLSQKNGNNLPNRIYLCFSDSIWHLGFGCQNETISQGRSYLEMNINISNCFFSRFCTFNGDSGYGGVIQVGTGSLSMIISYSMFYNCSCSVNGGAIHFDSSNSYLRMICANRCSCGPYSYYQFAYL